MQEVYLVLFKWQIYFGVDICFFFVSSEWWWSIRVMFLVSQENLVGTEEFSKKDIDAYAASMWCL